MRKRIHATLAVAALLATWGIASAQETTGTITGRLIDTQGLAVPGATVVLTGPQGAKSFVSDAEGRFQAPFLTPGRYDVRAELQGFKAVDVKGVNVSLGQTTDLSLKMEVGGLTETVEVTSSAAVVDTGSTTTGAVLSSELFEKIPVGRRMTDTLYLAAGVSGTTTGRANPSMSGSSGLDNLYVVDGVNVTNTGYGAVGSYSIIFGSLGTATPFDFVKEVQVKTGGYEAEFGQALGGVVNVVTKSGTNELRGSVFGYGRPSAFEGNYKTVQTVNGTVNTLAQQEADFGIETGGRVIRDRLFFFGALNPSWQTRTFIAPDDIDNFPLRSLGEVDRERRTVSYSAKATWQAAAAHRVDASFFGDPSKGERGPQRTSSLTVQDTSSFSELDFGGHNQTLRYDGVFGTNLFFEASFARAYNKIAELPSVDSWRVTDATGPVETISGGIGGYEQGNISENFQYAAKATYVLGNHSIKGGLLFEDVDYSQVNQNTGPTFTAPDGRQTATGARITILNDVNFGRIYRVTRANFNAERLTTQRYYSFFFQDQWKATDRLTINAGLRYEDQALVGTINQLQTLDGQTLDEFHLKNNWAPRIGVVYDVLGGGRSRLYANWGRFFARIPNDLAARALSADEGFTRGDYFDANLTQPIPNGVATQVPGQSPITQHFLIAGTGSDLIDPDTKLSYKDEFVAGFEWEAMPNTTLGMRFIHRNIGRVLEDISPYSAAACDFGVDEACSTDYILTNPGEDTQAIQVPGMQPVSFEDPTHSYNALELTMDRRFSDNWLMLASYRFSRLRGTYEGFFREDNGQSDPGITSLYDFPTNDPNFTNPQFGYRGDIRFLGALGEGPLPLDRPHQLKVSGNYTFDNGLGVGVGLNVSSGKPLTALASLPIYDNSSEVPETARGEGFETVDGFKTRTPVEVQVDAQASYALNVGGNRRLTLLADAFNLFNIRRALDYNAATETGFLRPNPDLGTVTSDNIAGQMYQAPFALRLGVRFGW
jgi:outer membrane receptor protein involved in Fe transport